MLDPQADNLSIVPQRRSLDVVIIDDDLACLEVFDLIVSSDGHRASRFSDGREAVERLTSGSLRADVVIVDWFMPDFGGMAVIEALRAHPVTAGLHVIVCTASTSARIEACATWAGCNKLLSKPVRRKTLLAAIEAATPGA